MKIWAEALPGALENVLDDAYNVAERTGATISFKFNNETVDLTGRVAMFYTDDHRIVATYVRNGAGTKHGVWKKVGQ